MELTYYRITKNNNNTFGDESPWIVVYKYKIGIQNEPDTVQVHAVREDGTFNLERDFKGFYDSSKFLRERYKLNYVLLGFISKSVFCEIKNEPIKMHFWNVFTKTLFILGWFSFPVNVKELKVEIVVSVNNPAITSLFGKKLPESRIPVKN